jgi:hypothetical protein
MRRAVKLCDTIVAIEDYQMRPDRTPWYVHVGQMSPATIKVTDHYSVYEPPRRTVSCILDSPLAAPTHHLLRHARGYSADPPLGGRAVKPARRSAPADGGSADRTLKRDLQTI